MKNGMKIRNVSDFWRRVYENARSMDAFARLAGISEQPLRMADEYHVFRMPTAKKIAAAMGAELREVFEEAE